MALGNQVATELFGHRAGTAFAGEDERVFCSPTKGTPFDVARYGETFRLALTKAGVADYVSPSTTCGTRRSRTRQRQARLRPR